MDSSGIEIAEALKKELRGEESALWTGRPPQSLLLPRHFIWIPTGLLLIMIGWLLVIELRPSITGRRESDCLVSLVLMLLGTFIAFVEPCRTWSERRRTYYALTNRRALIVSQGTSVASFFLQSTLETDLVWHASKTGTIRFGKARWPVRKGRRRNQEPSTEMSEQFLRLPDAAAVMDRIGRLCGGSPVDPEHLKAIPFVKRVNPERQYDATTSAQTDPLEYAQPVRAKLLTNEKTLYVGRPPLGFIFRTQDWIYTPFAAIWTIIALSGFYRGWRFCCPGIVTLIFAAVGLYVLVGRFFHDRYDRRRMWYAVTNRRCLIVEDGKIIETRSLYWNFIQGVVRKMHADGTASIFFVLNAVGRLEHATDTGLTSMRRPSGRFFERIDDPRMIEDLIMQNVTTEKS